MKNSFVQFCVTSFLYDMVITSEDPGLGSPDGNDFVQLCVTYLLCDVVIT